MAVALKNLQNKKYVITVSMDTKNGGIHNMGMTMTQKILASHAGKDKVVVGELIMANLDLVLGNDVTSPVAIKEFEKAGCKGVFDCEKIALVMDHFTPNKDIKAAEQTKLVREFAGKRNIKHYYDVGEMGVEHALLPEKGLVVSGDLVIGADSHTCTYGALGAFSTGVGSTDMAAGMSYGKAWFKVPSAIRFNLTGKLSKWVSGKDVILHIIGMIGVDGALYKSMEFSGEGVSSLSIDDRFTICNMAIEGGARVGYCNPVIFNADDDAEYEKTIDIDLSKVESTIAFPHLPSNTKTFSEFSEIKIDQVVIGSCTNGRYSDFEKAAKIIKGKKVAKGIRVLIIPATQKIFLQMAEKGLTKIFVDAGCAVSTPTCGPCLGGHMGILAKGERSLATTNRNFVGRMGHPESEVYLCSPEVAAASALTGYITHPSKI